MMMNLMNVSHIVSYLPFPLDRCVSHMIADSEIRWNTPYRHACMRGIQSVFPEKTDQECRSILKKSHRSLMEGMVSVSKGSRRYTIHELERFDVSGVAPLSVFQKEKRPMLFVSIHMGDFFHGLIKVAQVLGNESELGVVKLTRNKKRESFVLDKLRDLNMALQFFHVDEKPSLDILRFLRRGGMLTLFMDIAHSSLKTSDVMIFNRQGKFPSGPAELGITSKAVIVPVYTYKKHNGRFQVCFEEPLDTMSLKSKAYAEQSFTITQWLAGYFELWIKTYPDQWEFWWLMSELWTND